MNLFRGHRNYRPLLWALVALLLLPAACSREAGDARDDSTGTLPVQVVWAKRNPPALSWAPEWLVQALVVGDPIPPGVVWMRAIISGAGITTPVKKDFDANAVPRTGTVDGVPIGSNRTLTMQAVGADLITVYYEGQTNIPLVTAGTNDKVTVTIYIAETTAPSPVTVFNAAAGDAQVTLTWSNPTGAANADFAGVMIRRSTTPFSVPPALAEGTEVADVDQLTEIYTDDAAAVVNNTLYYYAAFAHDSAPNFATGQTDSAKPLPAGATSSKWGSMQWGEGNWQASQ